jgi:hypothetical protein
MCQERSAEGRSRKPGGVGEFPGESDRGAGRALSVGCGGQPVAVGEG